MSTEVVKSNYEIFKDKANLKLYISKHATIKPETVCKAMNFDKINFIKRGVNKLKKKKEK